jgi:outer membrane protein OmpA-like peptidoglycan-associated protein
MRKLMLAGVAMGTLAGTAQAQVQQPGFFGYVDGLYALPTSSHSTVTDFPLLGSGTMRAGDGWSIDGKLGYRFDGPWDIALGGRFMDQSVGRGSGIADFHKTDGTLWVVDLEGGYTISGPGFGIRPSIGVRYQYWKSTYADGIGIGFNGTDRTWGIGPRVAVDGSLNLFGPVSLFAGAETSFLFGKERNVISIGGLGSAASSRSRMVWDVGAKIGLDWEVAPLVHIAAGYRFDWFDGVQSQRLVSASTGAPSGRAGELIHGPFIRVAYNWGAPPPGMVPPAPPAPPGQVQSFIVFFDFDRATLTSTAVQTIQQAAAQAKSGQVARLTVTGHADRSGSDAYNMALSLRRANAVKNQLVRDGIAASSIAIIGRGESQPLVPTADGVREPQNRRVEIVLG